MQGLDVIRFSPTARLIEALSNLYAFDALVFLPFSIAAAHHSLISAAVSD
jgi:hypothetical protein